MKRNRMSAARAVSIIITVAALAALASCAGSPPSSAAWMGTEPGEGRIWILTVQEDGAAEFIWGGLRPAVFAGEAFPDENGSWVFHVDEVRWFESWTHGWTEATFSAYGSIRLSPQGDAWTAKAVELPKIETVREAMIMYRETGYYGERARALVERRWDRSVAVADFLREDYGADAASLPAGQLVRRIGADLFPEVLVHRKERTVGGGETIWAEGIRWDPAYTRSRLPEELHAVRDSGTLYRDHEESPSLVVLAFTWPEIWGTVVPGSIIEERNEQ